MEGLIDISIRRDVLEVDHNWFTYSIPTDLVYAEAVLVDDWNYQTSDIFPLRVGNKTLEFFVIDVHSIYPSPFGNVQQTTLNMQLCR